MENQIFILGLIFGIGFLVAIGFMWGWANLIFKFLGIGIWFTATLGWWFYPLVDKYFPMK